jgi:DNA invertase Pin-like site-specific DNA recombinase
VSLRVRIAIQKPAGRRLRVIIYARYSTEEQHPSSIDDQIAYCKEFLKTNGITDAEIVVFQDAEMSGELVSRPGIDEVRARIHSRWPDLLLCEDSSRLFRHETACGELIETAVDLNVRCIAINDDVDTFDEDWDDRLHEAARHHARANKYTARRIKRRMDGLWRMGAAIGLLRPGYKRKPTVPATATEPAQGPFFDEKDDEWIHVIYETYERVARKDPPWLVAQWVTEQKLPKCSNSTIKEWTDRNVIDLIKRTIYRGVETYRAKYVHKERRSGKRKQLRNQPGAVLTRLMEHLRIVPDGLWYAANEAITDRNLCGLGPSGLDHPLAGIPRDSRFALSKVFFCGVCKTGKMYKEGQPGAKYRTFYECSNAANGSCWNKATARQEIVHERLGEAIIAQLTSLDGVLDAYLKYLRQQYQDDQPRKTQRAELAAKIKDGEAACQRLLDAIEQGKEAPALLVGRLHQRQEEVQIAKAKLEQLNAHSDSSNPPTREQIKEKIESMAKRLLAMDRETGVVLQRLVGRILAVPYQQFGGNKVVLRAKFDLRLAALLPEQILPALQDIHADVGTGLLHVIPMTIDLFELSAGPQHFAEALKLSKASTTLEEIGKQLGITKRQAHIAVQYGRDLEAAGLTDPFIELTAEPTEASRWRTHPRLKKSR